MSDILTVFKSHIPFINYVTTKGKILSFVGGVYRTKLVDEIEELTNEVKTGHPHIWIDEKEKEVEAKLADPLEAFKARVIAEYEAARAEATMNPNKNMGESSTSKLNVANSQSVAAATAGGSGAQLAAQISSIKIGSTGTPK